jgi:inhibitor of cysteine peptidase
MSCLRFRGPMGSGLGSSPTLPHQAYATPSPVGIAVARIQGSRSDRLCTVKVACVLVAGMLWIPSAYAQPRRIVKADDSFNGRQIELHAGETLEIDLSENASTGFQWIATPESLRKAEKILHQKESSAEGAGGPPGKPGVRHFSFEATGPGTVELELHYRRPWETAKPPARKFKLRVRVRPAAGP